MASTMGTARGSTHGSCRPRPLSVVLLPSISTVSCSIRMVAVGLKAARMMIGSPLARAYEAPGRGFHWGMATFHPTLPRGARVETIQNGSIEEILTGPAHENDGSFNLMGALRTSMATCGYQDIAEFNRAELMVAPALQTEGKSLQQQQSVGMGSNGRSAVANGVGVADD